MQNKHKNTKNSEIMDFITIPVVTAIVVFGFYKLIELFVRKKERILLIDILSTLDNVSCEKFDLSRIFGENKIMKNQFLGLRIGSLLIGLGLGLMVGFFISLATHGTTATEDTYYLIRNAQEVIYGASTLLFGGLGLVAGFIIERKLS